MIHEGDHNDETDIEFLEDGRILATARLEGSGSLFGHKDCSTLIAVASKPYQHWEYQRSFVTRLDGPHLFSHGGVLFALGRHHHDQGGFLRERGSCLGLKRTALYRVEPSGLTHLSDLPSNGDTGYPGAVVRGEDLYISYYTNAITEEHRWISGMFLPSEIRMAKCPVEDLLCLARELRECPDKPVDVTS